LRATPTVLKWVVLLAASLVFIVPLQLIHVPAALLLGAMGAAILVAAFEGELAVPHWPYVLAQGLIGCLVARSTGQGGRGWGAGAGCAGGRCLLRTSSVSSSHDEVGR